MSRARTIIVALGVGALAFAAMGAANAYAEGTGLTAVTCTEAKGGTGTGDFATNHCETPTVEKGNFETIPVPEGTKVVSTGKNPVPLSATIGLANVLVTCEKSTGTGKVVNTTEGEVMKAHGTEIVIHYTGNCHARLKTGTKTCPIKGGSITTNKLTTTTGVEHKVTVKPEEAGGSFFEFTIEAGECGLPETKVTMTGELIGIASSEIHSHLTFTEATNGTGLKANGGKANYIGTEVSYMDEGLDEHGNPIEGNTVGLTTYKANGEKE
jgi:hypothetical protein